MPRYLKRGATYEGPVAINSDDSLIADLNNEATSEEVDITDLTSIALVEADIIDLASDNASETIDSLSGGTSNQVYELRPAANITALTITGTAAASALAGDIILPSANIVLNGAKGDYIKFVKRGTKYYQTDAQQYV